MVPPPDSSAGAGLGSHCHGGRVAPPPSASVSLFIYLFDFCLRWVFIVARGLSLVAVSGGYSSLWCAGFSLPWLLFVAEHGL